MVWAPSRRKLGERRVVIRAAPPTASPKPQPQPLSLSDLAKDKPLVLPRSYSTSSDASSSSSSSSAVRTLIPCDQKSNLWLELRESRATASILSQICGVSPFADGRGNPRHDIFMQKLGLKKVSVNVAMNHGNVTEPIALAEYEKRSGRKVASAGFISYRASADEEDFIGGSPDGIILGSDDSFAAMREALSADGPIDESLLRQVLRDGGVLEIKCPYASQPKYRKSPSDQTDKNARYMFQIQAMLEIMDLEYGELFVYAAAHGHAPMIHRVRVQRSREFWSSVYAHVKEYWFSHYLPARSYLAEKNADGSLNQKLPIESSKQYELRLEQMLKDQGLMPTATLRDHGTKELIQWTKDILSKGEVMR